MKLTPFCSDSFLLSNEYIISLIALLVVEKFGCDQVPSVAGFLITYSITLSAESVPFEK